MRPLWVVYVSNKNSSATVCHEMRLMVDYYRMSINFLNVLVVVSFISTKCHLWFIKINRPVYYFIPSSIITGIMYANVKGRRCGVFFSLKTGFSAIFHICVHNMIYNILHITVIFTHRTSKYLIKAHD